MRGEWHAKATTQHRIELWILNTERETWLPAPSFPTNRFSVETWLSLPSCVTLLPNSRLSFHTFLSTWSCLTLHKWSYTGHMTVTWLSHDNHMIITYRVYSWYRIIKWLTDTQLLRHQITSNSTQHLCTHIICHVTLGCVVTWPSHDLRTTLPGVPSTPSLPSFPFIPFKPWAE